MKKLNVLISLVIALSLLILCTQIAIATYPINGDFETGNLNGWNKGSAEGNYVEAGGHTGNYRVWISNSAGGSYYYISQSIDLTNAQYLDFWSANIVGYQYSGRVLIDSTIVWSWDGMQMSWTHNNVTITGYTGNHTVKFTSYGSPFAHPANYDDIVIKYMSPPPIANFTNNLTNNAGYRPLCVQFNDTSTNNASGSYQWSWSDGTANSTLANPIHTFQNVGNYSVIMTITTTSGSSSKLSYINVSSLIPVANFTCANYTGYAPFIEVFNGSSYNFPTIFNYDFGDYVFGSNNGTLINMTHVYAYAGNYTVTFTEANDNGTSTTQNIIHVLNASITPTPTPTPTPSGKPTPAPKSKGAFLMYFSYIDAIISVGVLFLFLILLSILTRKFLINVVCIALCIGMGLDMLSRGVWADGDVLLIITMICLNLYIMTTQKGD